LCALPLFMRLSPQAGEAMIGRRPPAGSGG